MNITGLKALEDNYIWLLQEREKVWIVDPGEASPVLDWFESHPDRRPAGILITHHHYDHTQGVNDLTNFWPDMPVYGPANSPFQEIDHPVRDGDTLALSPALSLKAIATPGHTLDHIAYIGVDHAFALVGDTLFAAGCGRLFEGTPDQMAESLKKLRALPDETAIYCGHEYTWANIHFAAIAEPDNPAIRQRKRQVIENYRRHRPCVPSRLADEKATNPFLRFDRSPLRERLIRRLNDPTRPPDDATLFAALRQWKDELDMTGQLEPDL